MKKIRKSNIAGEILFLFGIIILWQIFYVAGVDGLGTVSYTHLRAHET